MNASVVSYLPPVHTYPQLIVHVYTDCSGDVSVGVGVHSVLMCFAAQTTLSSTRAGNRTAKAPRGVDIHASMCVQQDSSREHTSAFVLVCTVCISVFAQ